MSRELLVVDPGLDCTVLGSHSRSHHGQKLATVQDELPDTPSSLVRRVSLEGAVPRLGRVAHDI